MGLTVNPTGERSLKQFTAYDPVARFTAARACRRATSQAAGLFLDHLLAAFPIQAIQADGGAEFIAPSKLPVSCRPSRPSSTARSSAPTAPSATSSTPATTCPTSSPI